MKINENYFTSHYTTKDKNGNVTTYQYYKDPLSGLTKKKGVGWKRRDFKSERQALKYLRKTIEDSILNQSASKVVIPETFGDLHDIWLSLWSPTVRESSVKTQSYLLKKYIFPYYPRDLLLKNISPIFVESQWAKILSLNNERSGGALEASTLQKIRSLFKQIMFFGFKKDFFEYDIVKVDMKIPKDRYIRARERRKIKFLDREEIGMLLDAIRIKYKLVKNRNIMGSLYLDFVEFMIRNGLRVSEVGALTESKIDFEEKKLIINEGLIAGGRSIDMYAINPPKTISSGRVIDLDDCSIEILKRRIEYNQRRQQDVIERNTGRAIRPYTKSDSGRTYYQPVRPVKNYKFTDSIFQGQMGNPVVYHSFNEFMNGHSRSKKKDYKSVNDILSEKYPTFKKHVTTHTFRYTHISLLAEAGIPIKTIMERVGHSDSKTTIQIYNQVTQLSKKRAIAEISNWDFSS